MFHSPKADPPRRPAASERRRLRSRWPRILVLGLGLAAPALAQDTADDALRARLHEALRRNPRPGATLDRWIREVADAGELEAAVAQCTEEAERSEDAAECVLLGLLHHELGEREPALDAWQVALQRDPQLAIVHRLIADLRADRREFEEAIASYRRALPCPQSTEDRRELVQRLARLLVRVGRPDEARAELERLLDRSPDDRHLRMDVAESLEEQGLLTEALEHWRILVRRAPDARASVEARRRVAALLHRTGDIDASLEISAQLLDELEPGSWQARDVRAQVARRFADHTDLRPLLEFWRQRVEEDPLDLPARRDLVDVLFRLNRREEGLDALAEALARAPADSSLYRRLVEELRRDRRWVRALEQCRRWAAAAPDDPEALLTRAQLLLSQAADAKLDPESAARQALHTLEELLALDPRDPELSRLAARAALAGPAVVSAVLSRREGGADAAAVDRAGQSLVHFAEQAFEQTLRRQPGSVHAIEELARFLVGQDRRDDARRRLRRCREESRHDGDRLERLASVDRQLGFADEAQACLEDALRLAPTRAPLRERIVRVMLEREAPDFGRIREHLDAYTGLPDRRLETLVELSVAVERRAGTVAQTLRRIAESPAPEGREAWIAGRLLAEQRRPADAVGYLYEAIRYAPGELRLRLDLVDALVAAGRASDAIRQLHRISLGSSPATPTALRRIAELELSRGRTEAALEATRELLQWAPGDVDARLLAARIHADRGDDDESLRTLRQAVRALPRNVSLRLVLSDRLHALGFQDEAFEQLWRAFELVDGPDLRRELAATLGTRTAKTARFAVMLRRLEAQSTLLGAEEVGLCRFTASLAAGLLTNAQLELERVLLIAPGSEAALEAWIELATRQRDDESATLALEQLVEMHPTPRRLQRLAELQSSTRDLEEATRTWLRLIEQRGGSSILVRELTQRLLQGEFEIAHSLCAAARRHRPDDWRLKCMAAVMSYHLDSEFSEREALRELLRLPRPAPPAPPPPSAPAIASSQLPGLSTPSKAPHPEATEPLAPLLHMNEVPVAFSEQPPTGTAIFVPGSPRTLATTTAPPSSPVQLAQAESGALGWPRHGEFEQLSDMVGLSLQLDSVGLRSLGGWTMAPLDLGRAIDTAAVLTVLDARRSDRRGELEEWMRQLEGDCSTLRTLSRAAHSIGDAEMAAEAAALARSLDPHGTLVPVLELLRLDDLRRERAEDDPGKGGPATLLLEGTIRSSFQALTDRAPELRLHLLLAIGDRLLELDRADEVVRLLEAELPRLPFEGRVQLASLVAAIGNEDLSVCFHGALLDGLDRSELSDGGLDALLFALCRTATATSWERDLELWLRSLERRSHERAPNTDAAVVMHLRPDVRVAVQPTFPGPIGHLDTPHLALLSELARAAAEVGASEALLERLRAAARTATPGVHTDALVHAELAASWWALGPEATLPRIAALPLDDGLGIDRLMWRAHASLVTDRIGEVLRSIEQAKDRVFFGSDRLQALENATRDRCLRGSVEAMVEGLLAALRGTESLQPWLPHRVELDAARRELLRGAGVRPLSFYQQRSAQAASPTLPTICHRPLPELLQAAAQQGRLDEILDRARARQEQDLEPPILTVLTLAAAEAGLAEEARDWREKALLRHPRGTGNLPLALEWLLRSGTRHPPSRTVTLTELRAVLGELLMVGNEEDARRLVRLVLEPAEDGERDAERTVTELVGDPRSGLTRPLDVLARARVMVLLMDEASAERRPSLLAPVLEDLARAHRASPRPDLWRSLLTGHLDGCFAEVEGEQARRCAEALWSVLVPAPEGPPLDLCTLDEARGLRRYPLEGAVALLAAGGGQLDRFRAVVREGLDRDGSVWWPLAYALALAAHDEEEATRLATGWEDPQTFPVFHVEIDAGVNPLVEIALRRDPSASAPVDDPGGVDDAAPLGATAHFLAATGRLEARLEVVEALLRRGLQTQPDAVLGDTAWAFLLSADGVDPPLANVDLLRRVLAEHSRRSPQDSRLHALHGAIRYRLGRLPQAHDSLNDAIQAHRGRPSARHLLLRGLIAAERSELDAADADLQMGRQLLGISTGAGGLDRELLRRLERALGR